MVYVNFLFNFLTKIHSYLWDFQQIETLYTFVSQVHYNICTRVVSDIQPLVIISNWTFESYFLKRVPPTLWSSGEKGSSHPLVLKWKGSPLLCPQVKRVPPPLSSGEKGSSHPLVLRWKGFLPPFGPQVKRVPPHLSSGEKGPNKY